MQSLSNYSPHIHISFHPPQFIKSEIKEYFYERKHPKNLESAMTWLNLKKYVLQEASSLKIINFCDLLQTLSASFHLSSKGLYLTTPGEDSPCPKDYYESYGRFATEGIANHIHLNHIVKNRIAQFFIGVMAIHAWIPVLRSIRGLQAAQIYLNEDNDNLRSYTLCVYSKPSKKDILYLEKNLERDAPLKRMTFSAFIQWAM